MVNYPPLKQKRAHYFTFFSTKHFCNAPTISFHETVILVDLVTVAQRAGPSKVLDYLPPKKGRVFHSLLNQSFF